MGINAKELNDYVIRPALDALDERSQFAEHYLLKLASKESGCGEHLIASSQSNGIGLYAISPESHTDLWDKYLAFLPDLASKVRGLASQRAFLENPHAELATNLVYATAIAWLLSQYKEADKAHDFLESA
jgi:hypothetical protein